MPNPPEYEHLKNQVRILSLNGGGARGLFTIKLVS